MLNVFKRVTTSGKYIAEIDGLRFLAISLVILFHSNIWSEELYGTEKNIFWKIIDMGNIGVQFFFVISGFIISMPFIKSTSSNSKINLKKYFKRRLTRLEPPYLIAMFGYYFIAIFLSSHDIQTLVKHYLSTIFYLHGFLFDSRSIINSVAWSLEIEIQFYIIAPFIFYLFRIKNKKLLISILSIFILTWPFILNIIGMNYLNILGYFHYFISGALLCYIYLNYKISKSFFFDILSVVLFFLIFIFYNDKAFFLKYFLCSVIFFIYFFILNSKLIILFFRLDIISTIGGMCYSIYLIHNPLLQYVKKFQLAYFSTNNFYIDYIIAFIIIIPVLTVCCGVFYLLVEKPFMLSKRVAILNYYRAFFRINYK